MVVGVGPPADSNWPVILNGLQTKLSEKGLHWARIRARPKYEREVAFSFFLRRRRLPSTSPFAAVSRVPTPAAPPPLRLVLAVDSVSVSLALTPSPPAPSHTAHFTRVSFSHGRT